MSVFVVSLQDPFSPLGILVELSLCGVQGLEGNIEGPFEQGGILPSYDGFVVIPTVILPSLRTGKSCKRY